MFIIQVTFLFTDLCGVVKNILWFKNFQIRLISISFSLLTCKILVTLKDQRWRKVKIKLVWKCWNKGIFEKQQKQTTHYQLFKYHHRQSTPRNTAKFTGVCLTHTLIKCSTKSSICSNRGLKYRVFRWSSLNASRVILYCLMLVTVCEESRQNGKQLIYRDLSNKETKTLSSASVHLVISCWKLVVPLI